MKQNHNDELFNTFATIVKADAYEKLQPTLKDLQEQNKSYRNCLLDILKVIEKLNAKSLINNPVEFVKQVRELAGETLAKNRPI